MKTKIISVPLTEQANKALYFGQDVENDVTDVVLSQGEFDALWRDGIWDKINVNFNLWIDEYEDENISDLENINRLIKYLENVEVSDHPMAISGLQKFFKQLKVAAEKKTAVFFYF